MTKYTVTGTDQFGNPVSEIIETGKPSYPVPCYHISEAMLKKHSLLTLLCRSPANAILDEVEEMIDRHAKDKFPNAAESLIESILLQKFASNTALQAYADRLSRDSIVKKVILDILKNRYN